MSTNSKPLGSQLSIAVSLAFDAIATDFPEVDIEPIEHTTKRRPQGRLQSALFNSLNLPPIITLGRKQREMLSYFGN
ncbi:hypothetical protein AGABI1DRAFT_135172 [Agaricus bisporus var. burnettii JB137-S8]|uniref:Uncharacterized protein n=1 Tax=Agaricus bisporus var. burnettii (strain JB137-S8 / ATCC MYA-4627 / FGSC 10392) TaxID=597362 RepID=K5WDF7_AGABU|nr:uncharacterized protein AGABI1DRAFT_135172 [Agaricus bisporus var. burnettii JB137-S8]EKM73276.1 hypothetical protein AGABI1DRAFT_135172 [Agaricus bisporus var. burnettii JB137-S8]